MTCPTVLYCVLYIYIIHPAAEETHWQSDQMNYMKSLPLSTLDHALIIVGMVRRDAVNARQRERERETTGCGKENKKRGRSACTLEEQKQCEWENIKRERQQWKKEKLWMCQVVNKSVSLVSNVDIISPPHRPMELWLLFCQGHVLRCGCAGVRVFDLCCLAAVQLKWIRLNLSLPGHNKTQDVQDYGCAESLNAAQQFWPFLYI